MDRRSFPNYQYQLFLTDEMDNIQKRSGNCRRIVSVIILLIAFYVNLIHEPSEMTVSPSENITDVNSTVYVDHMKNVIYVATILSSWLIVIILSSILHRIYLFIEEYIWHRKSRYGNNFIKLFLTVFSGGWNCIPFVGIILLFICYLQDYQLVENILKSNWNLLIINVTVLSCYLSNKIWTNTEFQHSKSHIPSTGTFMAYAAYYSYYKNILPTLKDRIEKAEEKLKIRISFKKLIILLPSSGMIPARLDDGTDEIQLIEHLPSIETHKEGTFNRKMGNPIYKISPKNREPYYCVAEGQNSLPVLKSMKQSDEIFKQQAYLLYKTLKEILDDSSEKETYLLFSYNDEDKNDIQSLSERLWNEIHKQLNK